LSIAVADPEPSPQKENGFRAMHESHHITESGDGDQPDAQSTWCLATGPDDLAVDAGGRWPPLVHL
jgi:hypothetical protein